MTTPILPNLLIAGSAKCATSSLHKYIAQHPEIFMSKKKEPRFITSQCTRLPLNGPKDHLVESWYVKTYPEYCGLFTEAGEYKVIGESSADTLYFHKQTIPVIKQYLGDPKIILVLRNPVKRAFSAYQHLVRDDRESLSFEEGLKQEQKRIDDNWELIYHYRAVSRYYEPVKAFLENFSNVKVILNEDLARRPAETLKEVFTFLGVDPEFQVQNLKIKHNVSGKPRSRWLHTFLFEGHPLRDFMRPVVRFFLPHKVRENVSLKIQQSNLEPIKIDPATANLLKGEFREEVLKLQDILKKDLSRWLD
ncbi:MAG TPA: sulfotransferase [Ohtaekwangia sp.]